MRTFIFIIVIVSQLVCSVYAQSINIESRQNLFNKDLFQRHLNFLGSDLFEGRAPGTLGGNLAAKYLALEFARLNLKPAGKNDTYYQNIPFHSSKPLPSCEIKITGKDISRSLKLNDDFLLYQASESIFLPKPVELVFVGYGIDAPEFNYDDYKGIDVRDKIAVILEGEPISFDPSFFDGDNPTIYSLPEAKHRTALAKGAKGTIIIPFLSSHEKDYWDTQRKIFSFDNLSLASTATISLDLLLNPKTVDLIFSEHNLTIIKFRELHTSFQIKSFPMNVSITFKGSFLQRDFISPNIIGMIDGNDPILKNEFVIVSAHYDHLGIGPAVNGDSIYNGVFDNAAGVASLLEIARIFSEKILTNKRSIIFVLPTAEESGLLGSYFYTQNPLVPLYKTVANINIDGVASFDNFKSIIGVGSEYSSLLVVLEKIARERNLNIANIPVEFASFGAYARSDQHSFAQAGIPSILISEGLDYVNLSDTEGIKKMIDYAKNIYHSPFDDLSKKINYGAVTQHLEIITSMVEILCNEEKSPEWFDNSPFKIAREFTLDKRR